MQSVSPKAYDRAITVFSPDGRLFQVEYAKEAIKKGTTAIGVEYSSGVILAIDKQITTNLLKEESIEKIYKIDNHIGVATSGLGDGRKLVDYARVSAQQEQMIYNEDVDVQKLTKEVGDLKQKYTQYGGTRPFGVSLLVAGVDQSGPQLYRTFPSGAFNGYKATAIGSGAEDAQPFLEENYEEGMDKEKALEFILDALKEVKGDEFNKKAVEISYVSEDEDFEKLTEEEVKKYLSKE